MHDVNVTNKAEENPSLATAIANLHMLMQYSSGETKPRKAEDPQKRYEKVLGYLMTGSCVIDDDLRPAIEAINQALAPLAKAA